MPFLNSTILPFLPKLVRVTATLMHPRKLSPMVSNIFEPVGTLDILTQGSGQNHKMAAIEGKHSHKMSKCGYI